MKYASPEYQEPAGGLTGMNNDSNRPELELFDDELSFVKKNDVDPLAQLAENENLVLTCQLKNGAKNNNESGFSQISSVNRIKSDPKPIVMTPRFDITTRTNKILSHHRQTTQAMFYAISQLTRHVRELGNHIKQLNSAKSMPDLAQLFATGVYLAKQNDHIHAAQYFRQAAVAGHAKAMFYLGTMFIKAEGLPRSLIHSYVWMILANAYGVIQAKPVIESLKRHLNARQIHIAQQLAAEKIEKIQDVQLNSQNRY